MEITEADIPGLFLQKAAGLQALLCANDFAGLQALSEAGVDLLEVANLAPERPVNDRAQWIDKFCRNWGVSRETVEARCPPTERACRAKNLQRYAITAAARALEAGATDAAAWAIGPTGFKFASTRHGRKSDSPGPNALDLLAHDGFRLRHTIPVATLSVLVAHGLLSPNMKKDSWTLDYFVRVKLAESTDPADARAAFHLPLDNDYDILYSLWGPGIETATRTFYEESCAENGDEITPEGFARWFAEKYLIIVGGSMRYFPWVWPDEFEYWCFIRDATEARPNRSADASWLLNKIYEKLNIAPKNAAA